MELTNISILILLVGLLPLLIGTIATFKYKLSVWWLIGGLLITLAGFIFKPVKLHNGASTTVQQSFSTVRPQLDESTFKSSVDQRYHSDQKQTQLDKAQQQFEERQ